uniref:Reverse transcriptase Ty1/copia-type domain-containing protein n=1 Tax=Solanum lycopersicum TaxID=4081 RepID=A0A3Q7GIP5_SOLLC
MTDCKTSPSPVETTFQLSIVGALQYATITRLEISSSVSRICQYMQNPTLDHWKAVKRILRYLKGSLTHGISITPSTSSTIHVYCDAGWAADPDDRRSHHGFAVYMQKVVARSSTEDEYCAIAFAASEYLAITRPDIQFAVNRVAQRIHQPSEHDYHCLKRILRYIFGTLGRGLLIRPGDLELRGFSDSDWENDKNDRKSTSGAEPDLLVYKKTTQGLSVLD